VDDTNGRIYRIRGKDAAPLKPANLGAMTTTELVGKLQDPNRWARQTALRVLGDRRDATAVPLLKKALFDTGTAFPLDALWGLYQSGGFDEPTALKALAHPDAFVRAWTARLLCDENYVSKPIAAALAELALNEPSVETRNQLACSARRLPAEDAFPIVRNLLSHGEDVDDPQIPLLLWWALEAKYAGRNGRANGDDLLRFVSARELWGLPLVQKHILARTMRRFASDGSPQAMLGCLKLLELSPGKEQSAELLKGFEQAFEGRAMPPLPPELLAAIARAGGDTLQIDLRQGQAGAVQRAWAIVSNAKEKLSKRLTLIRILGELKRTDDAPQLIALMKQKDPALVKAALGALQNYDDPSVGTAILDSSAQFAPAVRDSAYLALASRTAWATQLLAAVEKGGIERQAISRETVEQLRQQDDPNVMAAVEKFWGPARVAQPAEVTAEQRAEMKRVASVLSGGGGDPLKGAPLFAQRCGVCHTLFGAGGRVGPDLTPFKRDDLDNVLLNVVAPSAEIREGFENYLVKVNDGRRLSGIMVQQDKDAVTLRGADGADVSIARAQIEVLKSTGKSLMPEGVLNGLSDSDLAHLFAYVRSSQPPK
jgi:putative heme-binding domain-containing protein